MKPYLGLALSGLVASAFFCGSLVVQPAAVQAKTLNACGVQYGARDKKIKDGQALVVRGILKIQTQAGLTFTSLANDDGSCEIEILGDKAETEQAVACGNGAKVTIIGKFTRQMILPAVDPATISCR